MNVFQEYIFQQLLSITISYKKNKLLKLSALILFVMSPNALIYGNQFKKLGFILLIGTGVFLDQMAQIRYPYSNEK